MGEVSLVTDRCSTCEGSGIVASRNEYQTDECGSCKGTGRVDVPFEAWPKIHRLNRDIIVTEKIDGTNAQVFIRDDGRVIAGSRSRWLTSGKQNDNHGFASWVEENKGELLTLGPGHHFGEWWGRGIQRGYGLDNRRFSLFNTERWREDSIRPACCDVVPVLYQGPYGQSPIASCMAALKALGSVASPGARAEGVVIYHTASRQMFKWTFEGDESGKEVQGA